MAEQYLVSARKYRPDSFASIVGQGAMSSTLKQAVLSGRMAHAYLFCGPRGVGKTTAARVLAKTINCMQLSPEGEACNHCASCQGFNEGRSFNIFELDAASHNSVEDIRSLTEQVAIAPALGRYKVYIIDEVHMLSQAAFNAFLKTLEEPPSYAIFILATTEKHKVLPTILSRCQIYDFRRITVEDISKHLRYVADREGISADDAALGLIAEKADGGMRDALSMLDRVASYGQGQITYQDALDCLNILDYAYYRLFIQSFVSGDYRTLLLTLDEVLAKGFDGQLVMAGLAAFARDLLVVQHADTLRLLERPAAVSALYAETARMVAPSALHEIIRRLVEADGQYRSATNKRLLVELTLLSILTAFQPNALEQGAEEPSPQLPPRVVSTVPPPAAPPRAHAAPPVEAPSVEASQPQLPAEAPEGDAPTAQQPSAGLRSSRKQAMEDTRRKFRERRQRAVSETPAEEPIVEMHEPYTEQDIGEAWARYVEQEIPHDQQILRSTLRNTLPRLLEEGSIELTIPNSAAAVQPVEQLLPSLQSYLQRALKNTDLKLILRPEVMDPGSIAVTNFEKYEALRQIYPVLETFRQYLDLRVV